MALGCWGMLEGKVEGMLGRMLGLGWGGMLGLGWGGCWDWDGEGDAGTGMRRGMLGLGCKRCWVQHHGCCQPCLLGGACPVPSPEQNPPAPSPLATLCCCFPASSSSSSLCSTGG